MDYNYLWAKKKRIDDSFYWLPLYIHLDDTGKLMGLLWEHRLSQGVRDLVFESLSVENDISEEYPRNLAEFLGYLHDLGKASASFQYKRTFPVDKDLDQVIYDKLSWGSFDLSYNDSINPPRHDELGEYILNKYKINQTISSIIGAHHGRPIEEKWNDDIIGKEKSIYQTNDSNSLEYKGWDDIHRFLINDALGKSEIQSIENLLIIPEKIQVIYSGLLIMADWIASNENYFPLIGVEDKDLEENRLENGFSKWLSEKTRAWEPQIADTNNMFDERFGFEPRSEQKVLGDLVKTIDQPGILIYEAATGSGKTEASLLAAEILAKKSGRNSLFFALPSQATSNSIFSRVKKWLENLYQEDKEGKSIRLIHGKASYNDEFSSLRPTKTVYEDDAGGVSVNKYFAGNKLSILDDFTVGTIDQLLLMSLKQKHLMLRHLGFSNKVVIIDEVHAYDTYMNVFLDETIKWLAAYNVPVIILSATLPTQRRNQLIKSYVIGQGKSYKRMQKPEEYEIEKNYPLLSYTSEEGIHQFKDFVKKESKKYDIIKLSKDTSDDIVKLIKKEACDGGIFGIIVNTVRKCQNLAKKLIEEFGEDKVEVLHSSFISNEKIQKEEKLLNTIGKNAKRPEFKIIIGTQVIEQSLDIDFDVLYTDLAPMDLLIQRIGRLHRHRYNKRIERFKNPKVYVMNCSDYDFDKGSTYVYQSYFLMRTEYFLPNEIDIPEDVSNLVQEVYSREDIDIDDKYLGDYIGYKNEYESVIRNKKAKAKVFCLHDPKKITREDKNIKNWISNSNDASELSDMKASCQVRDGIDSVEFICLQEKEEGYGFFQSKHSIDKLDYEVAKEISKHTIKLPMALSYPVFIDKLIKELEKFYTINLKEWDNYTWLKGNLALIFDKNGEYKFGDYILKYEENLGLSYEKRSDYGKI